MAKTAPLSPLKWAPATRHALNVLIESHGTDAPDTDPRHRPYAVFDWDNTCIAGDCEETLLHHMAQRFLFTQTPDDFARSIGRDIPPGDFTDAFRNRDGRSVRFADLHADLVADYTALQARATAPALDDPILHSFRSKLVFAYDGIDARWGSLLACVWIVRLLAGRTEADIASLARASNAWHLGQSIRSDPWTTPETRPGRAGIVSRPVLTALRLTPEIADLQSALRRGGIDVFVCSASLEQVVSVFATDPAYGYDLPRENILGIRMTWLEGRLGNDTAPGWPVTYAEGKVAAIRQAIASRRGHGPLLVCGDSNGDAAMMTAFPDTQLRLIVNRNSDGALGMLARRAATEIGSRDPQVVLQGRDEATGEWCPSEQSIALITN